MTRPASVAVMPFAGQSSEADIPGGISDGLAHDVITLLAELRSLFVIARRNRAVLKPTSSLDAWEAHHRGLWYMYRFNRADNERARHFFQTAVELDPTFSRAHAGLSFTHFQNAFQGWNERAPEIDRAFGAAGQSLMADDRDPAAHWAMGRALWLRGRQDQSVAELETAVDLSPNFALVHYTLAFIRSQGGDPAPAIRSSDHPRRLSPFDPLLFGMLCARAMALVRLGRFDEAAEWVLKAAARHSSERLLRVSINQSISRVTFKRHIAATALGRRSKSSWGSFGGSALRRRPFPLKSALLFTTIRPPVSAFRCVQTSSSGLRSGE